MTAAESPQTNSVSRCVHIDRGMHKNASLDPQLGVAGLTTCFRESAYLSDVGQGRSWSDSSVPRCRISLSFAEAINIIASRSWPAPVRADSKIVSAWRLLYSQQPYERYIA